MKVLQPNREVLEDFARTYPDILIDLVLTESMYDEGWCRLAIEVIDETLVSTLSVPMLKKTSFHPSPTIRALSIARLFDHQGHDDTIETIWGVLHLCKMRAN